jgi:hypothetical protein
MVWTAHNSTIHTPHAIRRQNTADAARQTSLPVPICVWIMDCVYRRVMSSWGTDASGRDAACPKNLCPDGKYTSSYFTIIAHADTVTNSFGGLNPVPAWNTQQCDYGVYCCRAPSDRRSCCNNSTAPKVTMSSIGLASLPTSTSTSSSSTSDPTVHPSVQQPRRHRTIARSKRNRMRLLAAPSAVFSAPWQWVWQPPYSGCTNRSCGKGSSKSTTRSNSHRRRHIEGCSLPAPLH